MKNALVTTTINLPSNLEAYAKDIAKHGPEDTVIIVAADLKTPAGVKPFLDRLYADYDVPTLYLSPEDQNEIFGSYSNFVPWNCIQRRNMAILYAYRNGAEIIATIDDDNFWEGEGYFKGHNIGPQEAYVVHTEAGWFNNCNMLAEERNKRFYPRGYSLHARSLPNLRHIFAVEKGSVVVNAGLWLGEPDIDAVTRLAIAPNATACNFDLPLSISLGKNIKCPFNSQNTALHRDVIPAYCLPHGLGRYDDIIASYIVKRIADHLGDYVRFGAPVVRQVRNQHDLWKDLEDERIGMQLTDRIVDWLYEIPLSGSTYKECVKELIMPFMLRYTTALVNQSITLEQFIFCRNIGEGYNKWMELF
jgi:hypothetical protein